MKFLVGRGGGGRSPRPMFQNHSPGVGLTYFAKRGSLSLWPPNESDGVRGVFVCVGLGVSDTRSGYKTLLAY